MAVALLHGCRCFSRHDVEANHHWSGVDLRRVVFSVCCLGRARLLNIRRGPGATRAPFELTKALCGVPLWRDPDRDNGLFGVPWRVVGLLAR